MTWSVSEHRRLLDEITRLESELILAARRESGLADDLEAALECLKQAVRDRDRALNILTNDRGPPERLLVELCEQRDFARETAAELITAYDEKRRPIASAALNARLWKGDEEE